MTNESKTNTHDFLTMIQTAGPELNYFYSEESNLESYYIDMLKDAGVDLAAYWYRNGGYEGSGNMIFHRIDGWRMLDMSHCSCNGPFDGFLQKTPYKKLNDLVATLSEESKKEVEPILKALKKAKKK